ncbi:MULTISPECIES: T9SS type A sorting domain-containing protein [unclassified Lacinutrix]
MRNKVLFIIGLLFCTITVSSQVNLNCQQTCVVEKTEYTGALLGVRLKPNCGDKGAYIAEIVTNSAADKSVLEVNDLILYAEDIEIKFPKHFIDIVAKSKPFQEIHLVYERNAKVYSTQVVLDAKTSKIVKQEVCCDTFNLKESIAIYPNPAVKNLHVTFKEAVQENYTFEIFNLNGVRFFSEENAKLNNNLTKAISVENLEDGVYVLKIQQGSNAHSSMFVVKK